MVANHILGTTILQIPIQNLELLQPPFLYYRPAGFRLRADCDSIPVKIGASVSLKTLVPELRRWWKTVSHPAGLTETARDLCKANSISSLVAPDRKRQHSEVAVDAGMPNCSIPNDLVTESQ